LVQNRKSMKNTLLGNDIEHNYKHLTCLNYNKNPKAQLKQSRTLFRGLGCTLGVLMIVQMCETFVSIYNSVQYHYLIISQILSNSLCCKTFYEHNYFHI